MSTIIKNLKPSWSVAKHDNGNIYAYKHDEFALMKMGEEELITVYPIGDDGIVQYAIETKVRCKYLRPQSLKIDEYLDGTN